MKHTICNQVRFEIDEKDLAAALSAGAMEHLRQCGECQEFQTKETKLRQIVGSLETVDAPADFDFRLRARLASDRSATYRLSSPIRVWRLRSIAVAAMLLIFAGTVFMLRQIDPRQPKTDNAAEASNDKKVTPDSRPNDRAPKLNNDGNAPNDQSETPIVVQQKSPPPRRVVASSVVKRPLAVVDMSSKRAPVEKIGTMATFPLDVSQPSFKVSLDDGSGGSRTISVPTVSFGSRRVLMGGSVSSNQFAPKGDW